MNAPVNTTEHQAPNVEVLPAHGRSVGVEILDTWRGVVLSAVALALTNARLPELQRQGGVWKWSDQIPYPSQEHLLVLDNGCLRFELGLGEHLVTFSVWLQVGEVRVGVKIPNALLAQEALREKIGRAYDGVPCQRIERIGAATLYDWIWKDAEFAEFGFMVRSLRDPVLCSVIADRLASIATHLYMAVANIMIEGHSLTVSFKRISRVALKGVAVEVKGSFAAFEAFVRRSGYAIRKSADSADGRIRTYWILMPAGGEIPSGRMSESRQGDCTVLTLNTPHNGWE